MTQGPGSREEIAAVLEPLGQGLRDLVAASAAQGSPLERSQVDFLLTGEWAKRPSWEAYSVAGMILGHTADHLLGSAACIRTGTIAYSIPTLVRAGLESAAQAHYLMDQQIDTRERVRRWANLMLGSEMESLRLLKGPALPAPGGEAKLHQEMDILLKSARRHTFEVSDLRTSRNIRNQSQAPYIGERPPSIMHLMNDLLPGSGQGPIGKVGETTYRSLSSVAHSQMHGLRRFWMRETATEVPGPDLVRFSYGTTPRELVEWLTPLILATGSVGRQRSLVVGWPAQQWNETYMSVLLRWQEWTTP